MIETFMDYDSVIEFLYLESTMERCDKSIKGVSESTINKYRSLEKRPTEKTLAKIDPDFKPQSVEIGKLIVYVHSENNREITSNGKKIFDLLILGSQIGKKGIFESTAEYYPEVFRFLDSMCRVPNSNILYKKFHYRPGRSVSRRQIWDLGSEYGYTRSKINAALATLMKAGLVECSHRVYEDRQNRCDLFKLSASGCAKYLEEKTGSA